LNNSNSNGGSGSSSDISNSPVASQRDNKTMDIEAGNTSAKKDAEISTPPLAPKQQVTNTTSTQVPSSPPSKQGWLLRRSDMKGWQKRWFALYPSLRQLISYQYQDSPSLGPDQIILLKEFLLTKVIEDKRTCLKLILSNQTILFAHTDDNVLIDWMQAIGQVPQLPKTPGDINRDKNSPNNSNNSNNSNNKNSSRGSQIGSPKARTGGSEIRPGGKGSPSGSRISNNNTSSSNSDNSKVKKLEFVQRQLQVVPEKVFKFGNYDGLHALVLRTNEIPVFPAEFALLRGLTSLDFSQNLLKDVPPEIGSMTNLTFLNLEENKLESLPPEIGNLINLRTLKLGNGEDWFNVTKIYNNKLKVLPAEMGNLSQLRIFECSNNQLGNLPPNLFDKMTKLKGLDLSGNQLTRLPNIGNLFSLRHLLLSFNRLERIPPQIGKLIKLTIVRLTNNKITKLIPQVGFCKELEQLFLEDNPVKEPPRSVFKRSLPDLLEYLTDLFKGEEIPFRSRVMVVGDESRRLLIKALPNKKVSEGTRLNIYHWMPKIKNGLLPAGTLPHFDLWDFDPKFTETCCLPQIFYTKSLIFALVIRPEAIDAAHLENWFQAIAQHAPDALIIIIALVNQQTHNLTVETLELRRDLKARCETIKDTAQCQSLEICATLLVNIKSGKSLSRFTQDFVEVGLRHCPTMGKSVPRSVLQFEALIQQEKQEVNTITIRDFKELAALCCVNDEIASEDSPIERAIQVLYNWGVVIPSVTAEEAKREEEKSGEDRRLMVLSPEWLADKLFGELDDTDGN
jgi:Leucine-rich repeat (LRR) protein